MCFLADSVAFFKKMQSVHRYFKLFSHLPHRGLLVAVLKYSTGISDLILHIHSRDFVSRSWMVITTSCKRHSTQGVQDSKEITTSMQLSGSLKKLKIIIHEPEKKTPNNDGHNDRCPQCRNIPSCWVTNINNITLKLSFR